MRRFCVLVAFAIFANPAAVAQSDIEDLAIQNVALAVQDDLLKMVREDLADSGLAPSDIDSIVDQAVYRAARCQVDAFNVLPGETRERVLQLMSEGEMDEAALIFNDAIHSDVSPADMLLRYKSIIEVCLHELNQEFGISIR